MLGALLSMWHRLQSVIFAQIRVCPTRIPQTEVCATFFLKMRRPRLFDQQPQQERDHDRITRVVKQANWHESEDERVRRAPEPEVLMQEIKSTGHYYQQRSFHFALLVAIGKMSAYYGIEPEKIATRSRGC